MRYGEQVRAAGYGMAKSASRCSCVCDAVVSASKYGPEKNLYMDSKVVLYYVVQRVLAWWVGVFPHCVWSVVGCLYIIISFPTTSCRKVT